MRVLVAYASKYGSTQGIAEQIAATLRAEAVDVDFEPVTAVKQVDGYDAFVIGSAAFMGSWMKEATEFVRKHRDVLDAKPVWIFSSGPIGKDKVDKQGRDVLVASRPKEFAEFAKSIRPRDQRVFFGSLHRDQLRGFHRLFSMAPANATQEIEGDFRDWPAIQEWAREIAGHLAPAPAGAR